MKHGFTLIELLVVISIIGILLAVSIFGLQGARESARDNRRRADLELIKSGLELYKSDCGDYPAALTAGGALVGDDNPTACAATNTYIAAIPQDPTTPTRSYSYVQTSPYTYLLCASLEQDPNPPVDVSACGSCTTACNYKVTNP